MITYFTDTISMANVVRKLFMTDIILPQTSITVYIIGTLETNINKTKMMSTQISNHKFFLLYLLNLGHKPTISKLIRCSLTAHKKSNKIYNIRDLNKIVVN